MTLRKHSCHRNFHSRLFAIIVSECTYAYRIHIIGPSIWLDNWLVDWNGPIGQSNQWAGSLNTALQNQVVCNYRCNTNEILDCIMVFIIRPSLGKGFHVTQSLNKELYSLLPECPRILNCIKKHGICKYKIMPWKALKRHWILETFLKIVLRLKNCARKHCFQTC